MSIDLEWSKLDSSLSSHLVSILNKQLASAPRPSFIGPVQVTSLDFGSTPPDIELVDLRDIYRDFTEDDDDSVSSSEPVKVSEGPGEDDEEPFEWVSRRAAGRGQDLFADGYYRSNFYGGHGRMDMFSSTPSLGGMKPMNLPGLAGFRPGYTWASPSLPTQSTPEKPPPSPPPPPAEEPTPQQNEHPNVQLHLHITWPSDLRITLTTSLLINYPSPMFMSLPIKLSVTGLLFNGELVVAYEGARRRVHMCILDELDPYGPVRRPPPPSPEDDEEGEDLRNVPIAQRLLPSIYIETEIGQADKHVLKNVSRVERFIQDVIRKTVEEELVFPNFHTLILGDA